MRHKVTPRTHEILRELRRLAIEVENHIRVASPAAYDEWNVFRSQLPSTDELLRGSIALSEEDLDTMKVKAQRFHDILRNL